NVHRHSAVRSRGHRAGCGHVLRHCSGGANLTGYPGKSPPAPPSLAGGIPAPSPPHDIKKLKNTVNGIIPYPTHVATLDNGLKIIMMPMPANGIATWWSIVRTGSRDEYEEGRTGFAHFFEHMMFRGTEHYPADVYQQILTE